MEHYCVLGRGCSAHGGDAGSASSASISTDTTARYRVRPKGVDYQRGKDPHKQLSVGLGSLRASRAGKPARAKPRDKAHGWWVSNSAGRNACEA